MEIVIRPDAATAVSTTCQLLADRVRMKPEAVLGLATGRTMECVYSQLAKSGVSFSQCHTFNLDEYIGLPADDIRSYRHYMRTQFFAKVDVDETKTHIPDGNTSDLKRAAADYESLIKAVGGIDVQLLGIGEAGHIGFNEPLSSLASRTRDKSLTLMTRRQNAGAFGDDVNQVPTRAITMGVGTILDAAEIILLATGESKAQIIAKAVEGPVTSMVSASALQLHPNCKVILDEDAAAQLQGREYYDFVFANEPEWERYRKANHAD